jgi:hypothetical protein
MQKLVKPTIAYVVIGPVVGVWTLTSAMVSTCTLGKMLVFAAAAFTFRSCVGSLLNTVTAQHRVLTVC